MIGLFLLAFAVAAQAETIFESGPRQVALVELYTSQGCSSCPPADRWLSGLKERSGLWTDFVPLALHVDYWDYIGWQDPFAQPGFGQRQRVYEDELSINTIYTPGMVLNGREWRGWGRGEYPESGSNGTGNLILVVATDAITVEYRPQTTGPDRLDAHVAILGFDLKSMVTRGENRGRELLNDFIVLQMARVPMSRHAEEFTAVLPSFTTGPVNTHLAIAAWVEESSHQAPLQATGGWLPIVGAPDVGARDRQ
jgi:hypothetical protein